MNGQPPTSVAVSKVTTTSTPITMVPTSGMQSGIMSELPTPVSKLLDLGGGGGGKRTIHNISGMYYSPH